VVHLPGVLRRVPELSLRDSSSATRERETDLPERVSHRADYWGVLYESWINLDSKSYEL
jgi:hypothetical protein